MVVLRCYKGGVNAEDDVCIRGFSSDDYGDVVALWRSCGLTIKPSDSLRLMGEIEKHLLAMGASKINLLVEPGNTNACEFYRALGFSEVPFRFFTKEL